MAGFSDRAKDLVDLEVVPYPAVTVFIARSDGVLVDYASGQHQRGSLAAGLAPGNTPRCWKTRKRPASCCRTSPQSPGKAMRDRRSR
jgi:hypothetical protein